MTNRWGADFFGIADLSLASEAIVGQGGEWTADYPLAVSMGITLSYTIVDQLPHRKDRAVAVLYLSINARRMWLRKYCGIVDCGRMRRRGRRRQQVEWQRVSRAMITVILSASAFRVLP